MTVPYGPQDPRQPGWQGQGGWQQPYPAQQQYPGQPPYPGQYGPTGYPGGPGGMPPAPPKKSNVVLIIVLVLVGALVAVGVVIGVFLFSATSGPVTAGAPAPAPVTTEQTMPTDAPPPSTSSAAASGPLKVGDCFYQSGQAPDVVFTTAECRGDKAVFQVNLVEPDLSRCDAQGYKTYGYEYYSFADKVYYCVSLAMYPMSCFASGAGTPATQVPCAPGPYTFKIVTKDASGAAEPCTKENPGTAPKYDRSPDSGFVDCVALVR